MARRPGWQVGTIAGFRLLVLDHFFRGPEIVIEGAGTYTAKVTDTALGTIRSVEHTIQHLDETAASLAQNITDTRKRLADTQAQVEAPFEYAERLAFLACRQQEIEDELDLTKDQAPGALDGKPDEAPTEGDAPSQPEPEAGPADQLHDFACHIHLVSVRIDSRTVAAILLAAGDRHDPSPQFARANLSPHQHLLECTPNNVNCVLLSTLRLINSRLFLLVMEKHEAIKIPFGLFIITNAVWKLF